MSSREFLMAFML